MQLYPKGGKCKYIDLKKVTLVLVLMAKGVNEPN